MAIGFSMFVSSQKEASWQPVCIIRKPSTLVNLQKNGVLECWSNGVMRFGPLFQHSIIPMFQYSIYLIFGILTSAPDFAHSSSKVLRMIGSSSSYSICQPPYASGTSD